MSFLYPFVFFLLIPLYFLYAQNYSEHKHKQREKILLFGSLFFITLALSRPVIPNAINKQKFDAEDFIIALDASYSMQAKDLTPSRYEVAKSTLKEIIQALPKNRFSIFAFTSNAILISPPTTDTAISMMALDALEPKFILTKGTSILELLKTIFKTSFKEKNLIILSDGGEDHNLKGLVKLAKKSNIIPYVIATSSEHGSILSKNDKHIKDENGHLVISRINPILKDFALLSGGKYYNLETANNSIAQRIITDINNKEKKSEKSEINVLSYTELFQIPLFISIILFIISITKLHQLYLFSPLLFLPQHAKAGLLDFYHLKSAQNFYKEAHYLKSAKEFDKLNLSVESYYNKAVAFYKAKHYRDAVEVFSKIKTTDAHMKQNIYYNMGNCAVRYGKYARAKLYYQKALNLGYDKDSYENLLLLYKLKPQEEKELTNMLRKQEVQKKTGASKKKDVQKDKDKDKQSSKKNTSSNSNQKSAQKSNGSANSKKKKIQEANKKTDKTIESKYKVGYRAYELINKGYTNEKHPW